MTVAEAQERIDALEFAEWMAFWSLEPFGDEWRQIARLCAATLQVWAKKGKTIREDAFMPCPPRRQTDEEIQAKLMGFFGFPQAARPPG